MPSRITFAYPPYPGLLSQALVGLKPSVGALQTHQQETGAAFYKVQRQNERASLNKSQHLCNLHTNHKCQYIKNNDRERERERERDGVL